MSLKHLYLTLLMIMLSAAIAHPTFPAVFSDRVAVAPPAGWAGDMSNGGNGTLRTFYGVAAGDFLENKESGNYSNSLHCRGQNTKRYTVSIYIDGPLYLDGIPGSKSIPVSNFKYLFTYTNGTGNKFNYKGVYKPISTSPILLYESVTSESPFPELDSAEREFQFLYAVQPPGDTPPGNYKANVMFLAQQIDTPYLSITRTVPITVNVVGTFRLSIDRGSIDFDKMSPGETKDNVPVEGVILTSKSSFGNPWYLKISNDNPLSNGPYMIPNTNFIWYGWSDGTGRWYGTGNDQMTLVPALMYSSGAAEGMNIPDGTLNHLKFKLSIPKGQSGGKYITNVRITMTE